MVLGKKNEDNKKQVIKKTNKTYRSKITLKSHSDYDLFDEEIRNQFENLHTNFDEY